MKKTQKALVIQQYGGKVVLRQIPFPQLKKGEVLIKVDASTINPSDKFLMDGACFERPLPSICGIQGTGRVVDGNGQIAKLWIGTRVSFISPAYGSWVEYSIATPHEIFQIEQDIPINCAACGLINPLTALGFVERFRTLGCKYGMINTAATSALGRMLIRICKSEKIPLLNIVRKQEHKQKLLKEGADYIIVTKNGWVKQYKAYIYEHKFDCLLDALGGGPITQNLIDSLLPGSRVFVYGALEGKPIVISSAIQLLKGLSIQGFLVFSWWGKCSQEEQEKIRGSLNTYLVNQLSTNSIKSIRMEDINQGLQLSQKRASEGKFNDIQKPFNPTLGQTFQGQIGGYPVYAQQVSHHPPISSFLLDGKNYILHGTLQLTANLGLNSAVGIFYGDVVIQFDDGGVVRGRMPSGILTGMVFGETKFGPEGAVYSFDPINHLVSSYEVKQKDIMVGNIGILKPKSYQKFQSIVESKSKQKYEKYKNFSDKQYQKILSKIEVVWTSNIKYDEKMYFDYLNQQNLPIKLTQDISHGGQKLLPSDSSYRLDLKLREQMKMEQSQDQKQRIQDQERLLKKMREKAKGLAHKNSLN